MPIIDGLALSRRLREGLKEQVKNMRHPPVLAVILVGDDPESRRYVNLKRKAAEEIGARCQVVNLSEAAATAEVTALVDRLNQDPEIHGILVQLPLPPGIDRDQVIASLKVAKDVDGFHPLNLGLGFLGKQLFTSCGARAILDLMDQYIPAPRPRALLIGESLDLIKPLTSLLVGRECPVTVVPAEESWIDYSTYQAVVAEEGRPGSLTASMFAPGALVIDAGFHWQEGKTCGNAETSTFAGEGGPWLLPVPGGLGPLLITMLMSNLVKAARENG